MNKLKEVNGKFYQEAEVLMLATNSKSHLHLVPKGEYDENFGILEKELLLFDNTPSIFGYPAQHLYFLSNEEIKKGDWYLNIVSNEIVNVDFNIDYEQNHCKKIIATTDISLQLPQPSKEFIQVYIKTYNEGKPITKVLVEIDNEWIDTSGKMAFGIPYQLKVNSNNEVIIKKIKDIYTREKVIELLSKHFVEAGSKIGLGQNVTEFTKIWIEENL